MENLETYELYDYTDKDRSTRFHIDNMLNKTITMFKYNGLPDSLPERELELILQLHGNAIITMHDGNLIALSGSYAPPKDLYYRSKKYLVANPYLSNNSIEYNIANNVFADIGEPDGILIRNDPLDRGLMPILKKYGTMLTESDITMMLALINLRATFAITADNDDDYESAIKFLEDLKEGKQGSMMSNSFKEGINIQPCGTGINGYLTQIIEMNQYLKGSFFQEIGLQSTFNMKRERLSEAESGMDTDCLRPLIDSMLEERQKALEEVNKKYGTNITVEFNSSWNKYNEEDEALDEESVEESEDVEETTEELTEETNEESTEESTEETKESDESVEESEDTEENSEESDESEETNESEESEDNQELNIIENLSEALVNISEENNDIIDVSDEETEESSEDEKGEDEDEENEDKKRSSESAD